MKLLPVMIQYHS